MGAAYLRGPARPHTPTRVHTKAWQTARAEAALAGWAASLTWTDDGWPELIVSRWARTTSFTDLAEFRAWLERVKGSGA